MATFTISFLIAYGLVAVLLGCVLWVIRVLLHTLVKVGGWLFRLVRDGIRRWHQVQLGE